MEDQQPSLNGSENTEIVVLDQVPAPAPFMNRELSWIEFNARVLAQAADTSLPLLERVRFLSIFSSNLDEFFMKRVGGLKRQIAAGISSANVDGNTPRQQLALIRRAVLPLLSLQEKIFLEEVRPALIAEGIELLTWKDLNAAEKRFATEYFEQRVFPVLTPLSVDLGHPFPFLSNLSISLGFILKQPNQPEPHFARVKVSGLLPQWIRLPSRGQREQFRFLSLQELIIHHSAALFPGLETVGSMAFRVTRNIELDVDDDDAEDMLDVIEEELRMRRLGQVVRLEHGPKPNSWILRFLQEELEIENEDVFEFRGLLDYGSLDPIIEIDRPELKFPRWSPVVLSAIADEPSIFSGIRNHDLFVHHPYESFSASVERFIREASEDPKVLTIKMTVYRVGLISPLLPYLMRAAEEGKHVVVVVELKARFDEKNNVFWAQELEKAGVHVVYGIPGLKTHSKALLVVRQDNDGIRAYAHVGTGNYHVRTANQYTDIGLFTTKPELTNEIMHFFNYLTGRSLKEDYQKLLVAPVTMERRVLSLIEREIEVQRAGKSGRIIAKMNALDDRHLIEALYEASKAGVQIDLIVRGACCLRPQVNGWSENIRVISIVGRFLEHSRILYFGNGADDPVQGLFYIGSADWMARNLHRRVEIAIPIEDLSHRERCWQILEVMRNDSSQAWEMQPDGTYLRRTPSSESPQKGSHDTLMTIASAQAAIIL